ncbi:hypothetical protein GCM10027404_17960 [Arthrobacter tumbae]|uniref:hypothetical protein n=1 Tax=Arthrobacter tumbae TaxID=163874 RepID=UPI001956CE26|nr:hypothetical protein [Arthrobacter tumbae]MBM7780842.1 hypothetical protein [Arthrobacter tumbae]
MIPKEISAEAENALRKIAELTILTSPSAVEVRQIVIACASLMEAYTDIANATLIDGSEVSRSTLGMALLEEARSDLSRSWDRRLFWFETVAGMQLKGSHSTQAAMILVDLRNSLAHGTGGLSAYQREARDGGRRLVKDLSSVLGVDIGNGGELILSPETARQAILICRDFVLTLDNHFVGAVRPRVNP